MKPPLFLLFFTPFWLVEPGALKGETPKTESIVGHLARSLEVNREPGAVAIGSSRRSVADLLGDPAVRVGDGFWVYWDCRVDPARANPRGCDALVVTFQGDIVVGLKVSDSAAIRGALANLPCEATDRMRINKYPPGPIY